MNQSRSENTAPKPIQAEDALRHLTAGVGQLDGHRAAAYGGLATLRSAKQSTLERREKIYAVKHGAADRRVRQAQQQQATNTRLRQEIYVVHTQAATPAPAVDENSYVLHGFVRNGERQPLPRLTVALYDEEGQWLRDLGYGCTDENGYFILRFTRVAKTARTEQKKTAKPAAAAAVEFQALPGALRPDQSHAEGGQSRGTAEIRVYDAKRQFLHREAKLLTPKLGSVDFREIQIRDCPGHCVPPPGATGDRPPAVPANPVPKPRSPAPVPAKPAAAPIKPPSAPARPGTPSPQTSTPLENIKGVGPKTAAKLRSTGIKDIEALKETDTKTLIELAGTDKKVTPPKTKPLAPTTARRKKRTKK